MERARSRRVQQQTRSNVSNSIEERTSAITDPKHGSSSYIPITIWSECRAWAIRSQIWSRTSATTKACHWTRTWAWTQVWSIIRIEIRGKTQVWDRTWAKIWTQDRDHPNVGACWAHRVHHYRTIATYLPAMIASSPACYVNKLGALHCHPQVGYYILAYFKMRGEEQISTKNLHMIETLRVKTRPL